MRSEKGLSTASAYLGTNMRKARIIENRFLFRAVWYVFTRFFPTFDNKPRLIVTQTTVPSPPLVSY